MQQGHAECEKDCVLRHISSSVEGLRSKEHCTYFSFEACGEIICWVGPGDSTDIRTLHEYTSFSIPHSILLSQDSLLVEHRTRDRKVASSSPGKSGVRIFFSRELFLCADSYSVSVSPLVTAVTRERPRHFAKSAGGRLHINTHIPLTQRNRNGLTMLFKHSVGTY